MMCSCALHGKGSLAYNVGGRYPSCPAAANFGRRVKGQGGNDTIQVKLTERDLLTEKLAAAALLAAELPADQPQLAAAPVHVAICEH